MSRGLGFVGAVTVVGLLVGCSGGGDSDDETSPSATPTSDVSTSAAPSTETPSDPALAGGAAYLPTPDGRMLTEPGTVLDFKEAALVAWRPRQDVVGVVGFQVLKVRRTTVEKSLVGFELQDSEKASTPYFVSTEVGNGGETDLGGRQLPIYVVDSEERLVAPTGVDQDFAPCPASVLPAIFAPGDKARSCLIFLVAPGATLSSVMFRPPEGVIPLTWVGKVTDLSAHTGKGGKGSKGGKTTDNGGATG